MGHLVPFALFIAIQCMVREILPWFIYVFYGYCVLYALYLLHVCIKNYRAYNLRLQQTYADTKNRSLTWMIHLCWLFVIVFGLYVYYAYIIIDEDYIYYGIVTLIFYYINWNICNARETNVLEASRLEDEQEMETELKEKENAGNTVSEETAKVEQARQSLRELTKQRLEDTLDDICMNRRLYLNPDLTVMDLALELNTNRTYVSQYFSEHHTTFLKYINDLRVEFAMYQIKNTNKKVTDIMYESGFRHGETFRRAFQSRYNMDPRDVIRSKDID